MAPKSSSLLAERWSIPLDPARRDGRIVAQTVEPEGSPKHAAIPRALNPELRDALAAVLSSEPDFA